MFLQGDTIKIGWSETQHSAVFVFYNRPVSMRVIVLHEREDGDGLYEETGLRFDHESAAVCEAYALEVCRLIGADGLEEYEFVPEYVSAGMDEIWAKPTTALLN